MNDSQRGAVYKWERAVKARWPSCCDEPMTLDECKELVRKVWSDYRPGETPPEVKDGRGTRIARGGRWTINLPVWARRAWVVLHETAHSLDIDRHCPAHGRVFATLFLEMLAHYAGVPQAEARRMGIQQRPRRVHFAISADVPHRPSREWMQWKRVLDSLRKELDGHQKQQPLKYV